MGIAGRDLLLLMVEARDFAPSLIAADVGLGRTRCVPDFASCLVAADVGLGRTRRVFCDFCFRLRRTIVRLRFVKPCFDLSVG